MVRKCQLLGWQDFPISNLELAANSGSAWMFEEPNLHLATIIYSIESSMVYIFRLFVSQIHSLYLLQV